MKKFFRFFFLCFFPLTALELNSSDYLVSPAAYHHIADFSLYRYKKGEVTSKFKPEKVFDGAILFVKATALEKFFKFYHPKIQNRYVLITMEDCYVPGKYLHYLEDSKIIAWFGTNPSIKKRKKFYPIPIGINQKIPSSPGDRIKYFEELWRSNSKKENLAYLNITVKTNPEERQFVLDFFKDKEYCFFSERVPFEQYLKDLQKSKFIISPTGRGLDCFRTWEALAAGSYPIVITSKLDPLFKDLPVLILNDWNEINEEFLNEQYEILSKKEYNFEKLFLSYWKKFMQEILKKEGIKRKIN